MSEQTELEINDESKLDSIESYKFEPIRGYPMLNWKGRRPFTSTQYYPAQLKENHGEPIDGWMNRIYWGDNLQVMSHLLKEFRGKVDLVYIDPPFDSKAEYKKKIEIKGISGSSDSSAFEEKQYSDIWNNDGFLQFVYERLILIRELLSDSGSIFLHCDSKRSHHLRCLLDEVFGPANFVNEIIWHYRKWSTRVRAFQKNHDNILWYAKNEPSKFRLFRVVDFEKPSEGTLKRWKGKKQQAVFDSSGNRSASETDEDSTGSPLSDVWDDGDLEDILKISIINPAAIERVDYPTQKPEELLRRIIEATTLPGGLVFDCFMGSGTTQAVAMKLGRRFLGADINLGAVQTATKRLLNLSAALQEPGFSIYNVNHYDLFRNPVQAKDVLLEALEIQPLPNNSLFDGEKDGRMVKIMPVNRIATKADLNPLITGFDYKSFQKKQESAPNKPVESLLLVCMGHEPDLAAHLKRECHGFELDVEVVDILRDKANLEFKRDSEAEVVIEDGKLKISAFYPMNLLQKLSLQKEKVEDWRELTESVMIDWNYDGGVFEPSVVDVPEKNDMVRGEYEVPMDAGTIRVKITDLLSESLEMEVPHAKS